MDLTILITNSDGDFSELEKWEREHKEAKIIDFSFLNNLERELNEEDLQTLATYKKQLEAHQGESDTPIYTHGKNGKYIELNTIA